MDESLPFSQLKENELEDFRSSRSMLNLETHEISKLRDFINPFSTTEVKQFLTLNNELYPG